VQMSDMYLFNNSLLSFRFDLMGKRVYKTYVNLSNIIVRISDGTSQGKEHAVLVNAHLDSTLPSPGAADDALPVGIMLDCMRVLVETPDWSPKHAIIFCKFTSSLFLHLADRLSQCSIMQKNLCKMVLTCFLPSIRLLPRRFNLTVFISDFQLGFQRQSCRQSRRSAHILK
jgi:Peptidase family M28